MNPESSLGARPDFASGFFSLNRLPGLLQTRGAVLLRRLLPPALLQPWLPIFEQAYAEADRRLAAGEIDAAAWNAYYQFGNVDPGLVRHQPEWLAQLLGHSALRPLIQAALGPQVSLLPYYTGPRRQRRDQPDRALNFHQDSEFIGKRALNVWIPLTPAGGPDWPGLELWLDGPQTRLLDFSMPPAERAAICADIPPEALWRPQLVPGDVLLFTHFTVHRTSIAPTASETRLNYELRLVPEAAQDAIPDP